MAQIGDRITQGNWTARLTIAEERGPDYILQAMFTYLGEPSEFVEIWHLARQPSDAAIRDATLGMIDRFEATRLMLLWAKANLVGATRTLAPWAARVDAVDIDVPRREIVLTISVSKAGVSPRAFAYDLKGRTATLPAAAAEIELWLASLKERVAAAVVPPTEEAALAQVTV